MKRLFFAMLLLLAAAMPMPAAAVEQNTGPADTGDLFGVVIVLLLVSAIAVALLVLGKTRFVQEDCNNAGGR